MASPSAGDADHQIPPPSSDISPPPSDIPPPPSDNAAASPSTEPSPPPPPLAEAPSASSSYGNGDSDGDGDGDGDVDDDGEVDDDGGESSHARRTIIRPEVLRARSQGARQLVGILKDCPWELEEEVRVQYGDFRSRFGLSFLEEDLGSGTEGVRRCSFPGCRSKAMELTDYCFQHILSDPKQKLYKPCSYVLESAPSGPTICSKPILRSASPSLCQAHYEEAEKHLSQALKEAGMNSPISSKVAPKLHVLIAEHVRQIQAKRRSAKICDQDNEKDEGTSACQQDDDKDEGANACHQDDDIDEDTNACQQDDDKDEATNACHQDVDGTDEDTNACQQDDDKDEGTNACHQDNDKAEGTNAD